MSLVSVAIALQLFTRKSELLKGVVRRSARKEDRLDVCMHVYVTLLKEDLEKQNYKSRTRRGENNAVDISNW